MDESTMRDPAETTVPDPVGRHGPQPSPGRRRTVELIALLVLAPAFLTVQWIDDTWQSARIWAQREEVTVVRRNATGTLGRARWRLLGRDALAPPRSPAIPPGAVRLTLVLETRALDAQGVKDVKSTAYQVRDDAGHIWSALGTFAGGTDPVAGGAVRVTVTTDVPERVAGSVLLEARAEPVFGAKHRGPIRILRFAH